MLAATRIILSLKEISEIMERRINADLKSLQLIFNRNRPYFAPIAIIAICFFLFFQFVLPQFNSLAKREKEAKEASENLQTLKKNMDILTNTNDITLDSQVKTLTFALPLGKDFEGILKAIDFVSQRTGVGVGSFSFPVGSLSEEEEDSKFLKIDIVIPLSSTGSGVNNFAKALFNTAPLSEISFIRIGENGSTVNVSFYYRPFNFFGVEKTPINPISQDDLILIDKLNKLENISFPEGSLVSE